MPKGRYGRAGKPLICPTSIFLISKAYNGRVPQRVVAPSLKRKECHSLVMQLLTQFFSNQIYTNLP